MKNELKVKYFEKIFEVFASESEGRYPFYADYKSDEVFYSDAAVKALGFNKHYVESEGSLDAFESRIHPDDLKLYHEDAVRMLSGETNLLIHPYRILNAQGHYVSCSTVSTFFRDKEGNPEFFCGLILNHELNNAVDPTTGLFTGSTLRQDMAYQLQNDKPFYLMILGIRDFLSINNHYGYMMGNRILHAVGEFLRETEKDAKVYSLEGTKFALVWSGQDGMEDKGRKYFLSAKECLKRGIEVDGEHVVLDIFGGAIQTISTDNDANAIYTSAMYSVQQAKGQYRADFYQFDRRELSENRKNLELLTKIRESVIRGCQGFYMVYQPVVDAKTGKCSGVEALVRWEDENKVTISPGVFVEWLEKDAVFPDLGRWILKQAMDDTKELINKIPGFMLNINLAYPQLEREDFDAKLKFAVEECGFDPKHLRMEITERCRLLDRKMLRNRMIFIQSMGMQTSLDDFGTGYSALELMFDLPTSQIKIDRSFISNIVESHAKQIMLKAITDCAGEINASVCVEGVEELETADFIKDNFSVSSLQGYYYAKPLKINELKKWLMNSEYGL